MPLLSRLNPANLIPRFPPYPGPHAAGSFELEIPVASLGGGDGTTGVAETVQFRVFYPTEKPPAQPASSWWRGKAAAADDDDEEEEQQQPADPKPVRWLPEPHQREYLSAYARFLGASSGLAEIVSYGGRLLHYISLPALADAPLLPRPLDHRFPVMVFSHGLGGTRLAYSHICGSLASHGIVVIAPEHRDGSAPVSFVTSPASPEPGHANGRSQVDYITYPHHPSEETASGRNAQLEIRMREIGLVYTALCMLDRGALPAASRSSIATAEKSLLAAFTDRLDIRTPGRLIWAGHSFGASTMLQLIKTVTTPPSPHADFAPLFTPPSAATATATATPDLLPLASQITPESPLLLLDLWCLPLLGRRTSALFRQPLPQIAARAPRRVLAVMSDEFWRWTENLRGVRRVLSRDPGRRRGTDTHRWFEQWDDLHLESVESPVLEVGGQIVAPAPQGVVPAGPAGPQSAEGGAEPRCFYARGSAHLSQSDFGILFPRAVRKAEEPERILELNVRAVVQWLREEGFGDVLGAYADGEGGDEEIFGGVVEGWERVGMEEVEEAAEEGVVGEGEGEGAL